MDRTTAEIIVVGFLIGIIFIGNIIIADQYHELLTLRTTNGYCAGVLQANGWEQTP